MVLDRRKGFRRQDTRRTGIGDKALGGEDNGAAGNRTMRMYRHTVQPGEVVGVKWPPKFVAGRLAISRGTDHLSESIAQVVMCRRGTYFFRPSFGSGLPERVFDPVSLLGLVATDVGDAVRIWEPRVDLVRVTVGAPQTTGTFQLGGIATPNQGPGVVGIYITYRPRGREDIVDMNIATKQR